MQGDQDVEVSVTGNWAEGGWREGKQVENAYLGSASMQLDP